MKTVIFTDLDGTFLNHDDYSFADAKESLELLKSKKIPIVFTTSKTRVEVEKLQEKVEINEPFIIENGAAIFFPKNYQNFNLSFLDELDNYYLYQLGLSYNKILEFYNKYKKEFGMFGFSDMSVEEVINYTGLDRQSAILSKKRDFTEPFLIKDDFSIEKLQNLASNYDIKITKGGRFYHLIGKYQDKGLAVKKAIEIFENLYNVKIDSIGLGDGPNDIAMFENVKKAVIIKNHKNDYVEYFGNNQQKSSYQGSKGWNEMVLKMYKEELEKIYYKALKKVQADSIIKDNVSLKKDLLKIVDESIDLNKIDNLYIFGVGKAAYAMAKECEKIIGEKIKDGVVISTTKGKLKYLKHFTSTHPEVTKKVKKQLNFYLKKVLN